MKGLLGVRGFSAFILIVFFNAFVDLGHKILIQNTIFKIYSGSTQILLAALVNALILLPFVLMFSPAGFISDRFAKARVMRSAAALAVLITLLITFCYYQGWFWTAFGLTLALAIQSALYSPAKYAYIKELVGKERLSVANGVVQATTTCAILAGITVFSYLFEERLIAVPAAEAGAMLQSVAPLGWLLVGTSLVEAVFAWWLPVTQDGDQRARFELGRYLRGQYLKHNLSSIYGRNAIWLSIIGLAIFWSIGQVMLAAFPAFAKETLGETHTLKIQGTMALSGIGIILGSLVAGRLSRNYIETGLIPLGALGIAATLTWLTGLDSLLSQGLNFLALGFFGALMIVPLNALIQFHAGEDEGGRVLAGNNFVQNVSMIGFLGATIAASLAEIDSTWLFYALAVVAIGGAVYTVMRLPQSLVRLLVAMVVSPKYRLRVLGFENIPESGGVLMLGNHVSWIDWAIVQLACPRPVRFVMDRGIYQRWYWRGLLKFFGVIPISSANSRDSLEQVRALLNSGEVVCLFPEGAISRNGQLAEFKRGFERAADGAQGIILPFYLRGLWGSFWSRSSPKLKDLRREGLRRDILVAFGKPMPMAATHTEVKQQVFELSFSAWDSYTRELDPLPLAWLKSAKALGGQVSVIDDLSGELSHSRLITAVLLFARRIARLSPEQHIGLLLPASAGGVIANLACLLRGKTVVNLNYTAPLPALAASLERAEIRSIYTSRRFVKKLKQRGIEVDGLFEGRQVIFLEDLKAEIGRGEGALALVMSKLLPAELIYRVFGKPVGLESPAAILFSSGSEGTPKGVMLSHRNIMANLRQISDVLNTRADDRVMSALPPFHSFGLTVTMLMPLVEGVPLVCQPDPTDVLAVAKAVARHRATVLCATATFLRLYSRNKRVHPLMLEPLRVVVAGAEKLSAEVREAFEGKFHKPIFEGYGATETTPVASVNLPDHLDPQYWTVQQGQKQGTVGLPLPGTAFRIVDPETLAPLPTGEDGLILIGGTQLMLGYLKDPDKTSDVIVELDGQRWYKTGDKGHLDAQGFLTIVDRYSRFAKLGGEMISLGAVEQDIRPLLQDDEADLVAVTLADSKKGEKIVLLVSGSVDPDALTERLKQSALPSLAVPSAVLAVKEIPLLGGGKKDFKGAQQLAQALLETA